MLLIRLRRAACANQHAARHPQGVPPEKEGDYLEAEVTEIRHHPAEAGQHRPPGDTAEQEAEILSVVDHERKAYAAGAVVDASVLVSAFLTAKVSRPDHCGWPRKTVLRCTSRRFWSRRRGVPLLDPRLRTAYGHDEAAVHAWCDDLTRIGTVFNGPLPDIGPACRDPDDDHVIAHAVAIEARIIVTGDKDLLALDEFQAIRIVTARAFLTGMEAAA